MTPTPPIIHHDRDRKSAWDARSRGVGASALVAIFFWLIVSVIVIAGRHHCGYHLGQYIDQAVHARTDFAFFDRAKFAASQQRAREFEPRVYRQNADFSWASLEEQVKRLPELAASRDLTTIPEALRASFDSPGLQLLAQYAAPERKTMYAQRVETFFSSLRKFVLIPPDQHKQEQDHRDQWRLRGEISLFDGENGSLQVPLEQVHSATGAELSAEITAAAADAFRENLAPQIAAYLLRNLRHTHLLDENATLEAQDKAAATILDREGQIQYKAGAAIKTPGEIDERDLGILRSEHLAYRRTLPLPLLIRDYAGIAGIVVIFTLLLTWYIRRYQPRVIRNSLRAAALATLLVGMLLIADLSASGAWPVHVFGVAPVILTAIILGIAYEPRFALGIAMILAFLTTITLGQGVDFLLVVLGGSAAACAYTGVVRTRSRLIEIGLASAMAMFAIALFSGVFAARGVQPFKYIVQDASYSAVAGVFAGFLVLGVLPFIEKAFRITTGMTLLELSDASHPLQRKLAAEAPGTYNHAMQVATLSEAAAEAIGADSLLARVGALYHDVGKIRRPEYFCENQRGDNVHLSLSPNVSLMIILDHIKDGIELAKKYNLPTNLLPFIQQHHGTTLVEYFYHQARRQAACQVVESEFCYPGPRPRTREIAIVMLADACESASRSLDDPTSQALDSLVQSLITKRLLDGQLSDSDLTLRDLDTIGKTFFRALQSIYHARVAYPQSTAQSSPPPPAAAAGGH